MSNVILPQDILKSQISRSKELYSELKSEVEKDINNSNVSLRTLEITEDILTKLRNCLDKAVNLLQESKGLPQSKYLNFPICSQLQDFENKINSSPLKELILQIPKLETLLRKSQPFQSNANLIFIELHKAGSQDKHHTLLFQEKEIVGERISFLGLYGNVSWNPQAVKFGSGVSMNGVPINPQTQMPAYVPETHTISKIKLISIKFQGKDQDVLIFCDEVIKKVESIVNDFIKML